jgi:hypothetical protein
MVTVRALDQFENIGIFENRDVSLQVSGFRTGSAVKVITETETLFGDGIVNIGSGSGNVSVVTFSTESVELSLLDSRNTNLEVTSTQLIVFRPGNIQRCNLKAFNYTVDSTGPSLVDLQTDMDSGQLRFSFDETIDRSTINITTVTLQATDGADTSIYYAHTLQHLGTVFNSSLDSTFVTVELDLIDLNLIKEKSELFVSKQTSFISYTDALIQDMSANRVQRIDQEHAHQSNKYYLDVQPPVLQKVDLDLEAETLTITFDEPVRMSTGDPTFLTLHNNNTEEYTLTTTEIETTIADEVVIIKLVEVDVKSIKELFSMGTDSLDTFLRAKAAFIRDMQMPPELANPLLAVQAHPVRNYTRDSSTPTLIEFSQLDLNNGEITLSFSEPVDIETITPLHSRYNPANLG